MKRQHRVPLFWLVTFCSLWYSQLVLAHGDEGHSHAPSAPTAPAVMGAQSLVRVASNSDAFEAVIWLETLAGGGSWPMVKPKYF